MDACLFLVPRTNATWVIFLCDYSFSDYRGLYDQDGGGGPPE
jgi:hypothetical protein